MDSIDSIDALLTRTYGIVPTLGMFTNGSGRASDWTGPMEVCDDLLKNKFGIQDDGKPIGYHQRPLLMHFRNNFGHELANMPVKDEERIRVLQNMRETLLGIRRIFELIPIPRSEERREVQLSQLHFRSFDHGYLERSNGNLVELETKTIARINDARKDTREKQLTPWSDASYENVLVKRKKDHVTGRLYLNGWAASEAFFILQKGDHLTLNDMGQGHQMQGLGEIFAGKILDTVGESVVMHGCKYKKLANNYEGSH